MIFKKWRQHKRLDHECLAKVKSNVHDVRCVDLKSVKVLGPDHDERKYVGRIGIFTEDMFFVDIPALTWYCRHDGNIWTEWLIRDPKNEEIIEVPMSSESKRYINNLSKELWTMHKLGSTNLL